MPPLIRNLKKLPINLPDYPGGSPPFSTANRPKFHKALKARGIGNKARTIFFEQNLIRLYKANGRAPVPYAFRTRNGQVRSLDAGCLAFLANRSPSEVAFERNEDGYIIAAEPLPALLARYERGNHETSPTPLDDEAISPGELLESLHPDRRQNIIDLVRAAGLDVSRWGIRKDGSPVSNPNANPAWCYEWAFGGVGEPAVICVWHELMKVRDGRVVIVNNLRKVARNEAIPARAERARKADAIVHQAFQKSAVLRVIVLEGISDLLGNREARAPLRKLDPKPWTVTQYNDRTGAFVLTRGIVPITGSKESADLSGRYVDQFDVGPSPSIPVQRSVRVRLAEVRERARLRAKGHCELCGERGFLTSGGALYLETHHVIPLGSKGPDAEWNVVALCPDDHMRAHFSAEAMTVQKRLIEVLGSKYSGVEKKLKLLRNRGRSRKSK